MIKQFIFLTKPGIIFGNFISVMGGFFLAAQGDIDLWLLIVALLGTSLVVASGCVINNIIDQDIDIKMERTRNRALVKKSVSNRAAYIFAALLGIAGFGLLYCYSNWLAFAFAVIGYFDYVVLYSFYFKRHSVHQTLVGSISGAAPPVIGYCVASGQFDIGALIVFITFCIWQMPHSFGIAVYRLNDYVAAQIPVLPAKKGIKATKIQSFIYVLLFTMSGSLLYVFNYVGIIYLVVFLAMSAYWLYQSVIGFKAVNDQLWAKKFFLVSVIIISVFSVCISLDYQKHPNHIFIISA